MSFSEWHKVRLDKANIDIIDGDRGKNYPKKNEFYSEGHCLFLNAKNVTSEGFSFSETMYIDKEKDNLLRKGKLKRRDIVLTTRGTVGNVAFYGDRIKHENIRINSGMVILRPDITEYDSEYIYWLFRSPMIQEQINSYRTGSAQPQLPIKIMKTLEFNKPPLQEQKAIAQILSTLDEKIEVNNRINKTLEEMAQTIFKHWFVDFEFPNEDGEPYKSSGGQMVDSDLGPIPKGWEVTTLEQVVELHDSKRIPLSGNVREKMEKIYPYYGAAALMDYVDDYIFDGNYILLGEDGTVITDDGKPILQYVWGKFWVNNHAHVITGKNGLSINFVYNLLRLMDVNSIITGAVQKKINQGNLLSHRLVLPKDFSTIDRYSGIISSLYNQYMESKEENIVLGLIRNTLLPKLMSGEIRVPLDNEE